MAMCIKPQLSFSGVSYGTPDNLETRSPPPEQIIKGSNLHPRTMGSSDSTKKLCFVPKSKTVDSNKLKSSKENDRFFNNPLFGRLLTSVPQMKFDINDSMNTEITIPVIEEGIIKSLIRINKIFEMAPFIDFDEIDNLNIDDAFENFCFYNSFHSLASFNNISELYKSSQTIIYRVKSRIDQQWYCLKTGINYCDSDKILKVSTSNRNILKEIQILSTLNHENIVTYYKSWLEQQSFFLQIEYLVGESLYYFMYSTNNETDEIHKKKFLMKDEFPLTNRASEPAVCKVIQQISQALYYLHEEKKLVHNNIKSANILVTLKDSESDIQYQNATRIRSMIYENLLGDCCRAVLFKLIDFSCALCADADMKTEEHNYFNYSQDQIIYKENRENLPSRDIYSLGMTAIHLLNGPSEFASGVFKYVENVTFCRNKELQIAINKMIDSQDVLSSKELIDLTQCW